jgi:LacI family transcriptional regulator
VKHPYPIREIAERAGVSEATVDRVLHERGGVRESTVRRVQRAVADLDRRDPPYERTIAIDVVVPRRQRVREALEAELPGLLPTVIRPRFRSLDALGRSRSRGLILDAPDTPEVNEVVGRLGVPVVTLGTDLPASKRIAHVGADDAEAGATAAYLVEQWLADRAGDVLIVEGGGAEGGFRAEMTSRAPNRRLLGVALEQVRPALAANPSVRAVYSAARDNAAVVGAFAAEHRNYDVFVAHDLDDGNAELLRSGRISAVLHHDLRAALRTACRAILQALGALPGPVRSAPAPVRVITPMNILE